MSQVAVLPASTNTGSLVIQWVHLLLPHHHFTSIFLFQLLYDILYIFNTPPVLAEVTNFEYLAK